MKPKKLQQRLGVVNTARVGTLDQKAGNSARPRGRAWMTQRERIAARDGYVCACCGLVWQPSLDQVDHVVELEDGEKLFQLRHRHQHEFGYGFTVNLHVACFGLEP